MKTDPATRFQTSPTASFDTISQLVSPSNSACRLYSDPDCSYDNLRRSRRCLRLQQKIVLYRRPTASSRDTLTGRLLSPVKLPSFRRHTPAPHLQVRPQLHYPRRRRTTSNTHIISEVLGAWEHFRALVTRRRLVLACAASQCRVRGADYETTTIPAEGPALLSATAAVQRSPGGNLAALTWHLGSAHVTRLRQSALLIIIPLALALDDRLRRRAGKRCSCPPKYTTPSVQDGHYCEYGLAVHVS